MRRFLGFFSFVFTAAVVVTVLVFGWGYKLFTEPGPRRQEIVLLLPKGSGVAGIAGRLQRAGLITDQRVFRLGVRWTGSARRLKAGEYSFAAASSMRQIVALLVSGKTVVRRFTVAEGLTSAQIHTLLEGVEGLSGKITEPGGEGTLLPETYHFAHGDARQGMLKRMQTGMKEALAELWPRREKALPLSVPGDAVILASIIEKETGVAGERPRIAGVFINRLRLGMRLQSDPTVVYALTLGSGPLGRPLKRADLAIDSPYNTYRNKGLPPTPIANPGREALAAVLQPARTKDLYFVADGSGGHVFATTYAAHQKNVQRWRRFKKQMKSTK
jgi:UPF0755 protein